MKCGLYNVPYSTSFMDVLAQKFLAEYKDNPLDLGGILFLVPNRRSAQNLKEAFLQANNLTPFLLPKILPVYEADEDEVFFQNGGEIEDALPAAISNEERLFLFAKLIAAQKSNYGIKEMSYAQSLSLATCLAKLIDDATNQLEDPLHQNLSFEKLQEIVPQQKEYAAHWQVNLDFLKIVTAFWPEILKNRNLIDAAHRRNCLLQKQAAAWQKNPNMKIVAAGIGVPFNALKNIIKVLGEMENAEIYLYGLDKDMPPSLWKDLSPTHPQYGKKELLDILGATPADVKNIAKKTNINREKLVFELMRDAETTDQWRLMKNNQELIDGFKKISLIKTADKFEEALAIALIMREVLQTPQKTAALVTPDRDLARMVASALKRFGIEIDDSAGLPLHLSPIGIYLRQILDVLENDFSEASVAALLKSNFVKMKKSAKEIKQQVYEAEYEKRLPYYGKTNENPKQEALNEVLRKFYEDLQKLYNQSQVPLTELIKAHIALAEKLAEDDTQSGAQNLWRHEDGRQCAALIANILEKADEAGPIPPKEYAAVFLSLLSLEMVRKPYGTHPRLKILGLIEARFCSYDVMIAGSLNDGVWPKKFDTDPFMSRAMKADFGLTGPEKQIAQTADDLCAILNAKEVYLTRAMRADGVPTNKSKYWLRIETLIKALGLETKDVEDGFYTKLAQKMNKTQNITFLEPVSPTPPVQARPRRFSATDLTTWMQSPYDIYANKILNLKKLDELDQKPSSQDFGNFMHKVLERFCNEYPTTLDENAETILRQIAKQELDAAQIDSFSKVFWLTAADKMLTWFWKNEISYRSNIDRIETELKGEIEFSGPAGKVTLTARADRIDLTKDGCYQIVDYKTGGYPKKSEVVQGFAPQLPLEGLIAQSGGFKTKEKVLPAKPVKKLLYFSLGQKADPVVEDDEKSMENVLSQTKEYIQKMIDIFDQESTPYLYNPNPQNTNKYTKYEHLARFKEWKGRGQTDE